MRAIIAVTLSVACMAGCSDGYSKYDVRPVVELDLKDAASAEYRNEIFYKHTDGGGVLCGEVNSKNSYGAMAGFSEFVAWRLPDGRANSVLAPSQGSSFVEREAYRQIREEYCRYDWADPRSKRAP